jgi:DNA-binding LacI/PurR family transcriptional regulator
MNKHINKKEPTSNDVARLAGVSQSTVSRSFDPQSAISPQTRARVLAAAEIIGYQPNVIARSLITQQTNIVGIIMENLTASHFYSVVLEKLAHQLQERGKKIMLLNVPPGQSVDKILPQVLGYQVDAVIIASMTPEHEMIDISNRGGRPVILFNRYVTNSNASVVCCDNVEGGRLVADFLMDLSFKRIAYVSGPENTTTNLMRHKGFSERLQERGYGDYIYQSAAYSYDAGWKAARELLTRQNPPDAVFCAADIIALGLMDAARHELGMQIPNDLSVVGFDDIASAKWSSYDLTTIRQPVDNMIAVTLEILENNEAKSQSPEVKLVSVELIVRGSTRKNAS